MKRFSLVFMFVSICVAAFTLASCGDDDDVKDDLNAAQKAIAARYAGTYSGKDSITVGMGRASWKYATATPVSYRITANDDGTINITIPEESYDSTEIGDITIGSYTIDSLKYTVVAGYTRAYKGSSAKVHFKSTGGKDYPIILNDDYSFTSDACLISVRRNSLDGSIEVNNVYSLGRSPVLITNSFAGTK